VESVWKCKLKEEDQCKEKAVQLCSNQRLKKYIMGYVNRTKLHGTVDMVLHC